MAASPSRERIARVWREGLQKLVRKLAVKGIESEYIKGSKESHPYVQIKGCNAYSAGYRLLRASNGECALYPYIFVTVHPSEGETRCKKIEGWGVFDKIEKSNQIAKE